MLNNRVTGGVTPRVVPRIEARFTKWAQRESKEREREREIARRFVKNESNRKESGWPMNPLGDEEPSNRNRFLNISSGSIGQNAFGTFHSRSFL